MKILAESKLIVARKDGKWTKYSIDKSTAGAFLNRIKQVFGF